METTKEFSQNVKSIIEDFQPEKYSVKELHGLKMFIDKVRDEKARASLACWGNHGQFSKGY